MSFIEFVLNVTDARPFSNLSGGTYYLLNTGQIHIGTSSLRPPRDFIGVERSLRGLILEVLGKPWNGSLTVNDQELHYLGVRRLTPLDSNPKLEGFVVPKFEGHEQQLTMTEWFRALLPALQNRRDIWLDPDKSVFRFDLQKVEES